MGKAKERSDPSVIARDPPSTRQLSAPPGANAPAALIFLGRSLPALTGGSAPDQLPVDERISPCVGRRRRGGRDGDRAPGEGVAPCSRGLRARGIRGCR